MSGKSTMKNFKAMLAEARLPETTVMICMRGDLAADHEAAERELEKADKDAGDSLAGSGVGELVDRIQALEAQMREHTYEFRLRALPRPRWRALVNAHPPRRGDDNEILAADMMLVNTETFFDELIRVSLVDPELTDDEFQQLTEALTDRQHENLWEAAWGLNRREVDIPFSRAASRMKAASAGE
jgi:hypothetical protein